MHLMDRVVPLNEPLGLALCVGGGLAAAVGIWFSARRVRPAEIPRIGMITVWVFVASSIAVPIAGVSVHLGLYGLAGFFLRRRLFLATVPALLLQLLLLQHGGWTTLGINTVITSCGAFVGWGMAALALLPLRVRAFLAGSLGVMAGAALTAAVLLLSHYNRIILSFFTVYAALALLEGVITVVALEAIIRIHPGGVSKDSNSTQDEPVVMIRKTE